MTEKSIMIVGHSSGTFLGGAELSLLDFVRSLVSLGRRVVVIIPSEENQNYIQEIKKYTKELYIIRINWWAKEYFPNPEIVKVLSEIALNTKAEMIMSNTITMREPLLAARNLSIPSVCIVREVPEDGTKLANTLNKSLAQIISEIHSHSDYIIANSKYTLNAFYLDGKTAIVRNTYDENLSTLVKEAHPTFNVGFLGSSSLEKGLDDLIKIARNFESDNRIRFYSYGEFIASLLPAMAADLPTNIDFMGYELRKELIYGKLDLVLQLSTLNETFSRVTLEAMAANVPVIAYNRGALAELVNHGVTGFLVQPRETNEVQELISHLLQHRESLVQMGREAREFAISHYSPDLQKGDLQTALAAITRNHAKKSSTLPDFEIKVSKLNRSHHKEPFLVGNRARLATATGVKFVTDNQLVVASLLGRQLHLYEFNLGLRTSKLLSTVDTQNGKELVSIDAFDFNGKDLLVGADCESSSISTYRVWHSTLEYVDTFQVGEKPKNYIHGAKFVSSDPEVMAACITDGEKGITFYDRATGERLGHYSTGDWGVKDMAMVNLNSNEFIAMCTKNNVGRDLHTKHTIALKFVQINKRFGEFKVLSEYVFKDASMETIQIRGEYIYLACQSSDSVIVMRHDKTSIHLVDELHGFSFPHGVDISPDGKWMAVANYGSSSISIRENNHLEK
jgi:glycosyltransferase involved in cell wall biosynthesis